MGRRDDGDARGGSVGGYAVIVRDEIVAEYERRLVPVSRQVGRAEVLTAITRSVTRAAGVLAACAVAVTLAVAVGGPAVVLWTCAVLAFVVCAAIPVVRAAFRGVRLADAAERLDLALGDHNRIATGYDLARTGVQSSFSVRAVQEGLAQLRAHGDRRPALPTARLDVPRVTACFSTTLSLFVLSLWFASPETFPGLDVPGRETTALAASRTSRPDEPASRPSTSASPAQAQPTGIVGAGATTLPAVATRGPSTGDAATSASAAPGGAGAVGGESPKSDEKSAVPKPVDQQRQQATASQTSSAASASAGGSAKSPTGPSASVGDKSGRGGAGNSPGAGSPPEPQQALARADSQTDPTTGDEGDAQAVEQESQSQYQSGTMPLRQDRGNPVSRELGQSGVDGGGGTGRGGPGEGKKARGAGAVFLSVPMPDYVPGKLSAGTSRVDRQFVPPQPPDQRPPAPADVAKRRTDEGVIRRFDPAPGAASDVARYFDQLHLRTAPRQDAPQPPTTTDQEPN